MKSNEQSSSLSNRWLSWIVFPVAVSIVLGRKARHIIRRHLASLGQDQVSEREKTAQRMLAILNEGYGHWRSVQTREVINADGEPIPWYTYPAIEYLSQLDFKDKTVFEWGAGNSSLYWAKAAKAVTSVEDDPYWYHQLEKDKEENLTLTLIEAKEQYIEAIDSVNQKYDVIAIDGSYRYECALIAPRYLKKGGLIILDNADWLPKSAEALRSTGLLQVDMSGFAPIARYTYTTSLFFHRDFRITAKDGQQPHPSIGAIPIPEHFLYQEPR
jgi:hypothetical protein